MAYLVSIAPRAERDLANLYEYINAEHSDAAPNWYTGLKRAILSLGIRSQAARLPSDLPGLGETEQS